MSTRGFIGFKKDNEIKGVYNHYDSYYDGLGINMLKMYRHNNIKQLREFFLETLEFTDDNRVSTDLDLSHIDPTNLPKGKYKLVDDSYFLYDGLFCEYGYVFNLDNDTLELYRGFFDFEQRRNEINIDIHKIKNIFRENQGEYFTHMTCIITRDDIEKAEELFKNWSEIQEKYEDELYPEQLFFKETKNKNLVS